MNRIVAAAVLGTLLTSCSREPQGSNVQRPSASTPSSSIAPRPNVVTPRPRPTIDPKSSEAAEDLVRGFVRLLNQGKVADAYMLLGPNAPPRREFEHQWKSYSDLNVTTGRAGAQDGAAGSIYVSVPLTISGRLNHERVTRSATAVLRRVNDVPGSTEMQRRWHIERIDFSNSG